MIKHWLLRKTLRQGTVYYMQHRKLNSREPHYLVVLNKEPLEDDVICTAVITSNIHGARRRRRYYSPETLVEFGHDDYDVLKKPSMIDCNSPITMPSEDFETNVLNVKIAKPCSDFPEHLLKRVISGVEKSGKVSRVLKNLILGTSSPPGVSA